jgi:hypothetical protein
MTAGTFLQSRLLRSAPGSFFGDCLAERRIDLCETARVILLFNLDLDAEAELKLCNGSLGVVGPAPTREEVLAALEAKLGELAQQQAAAEEQQQGAHDERAREVLIARSSYYRLFAERLARWVHNDPSSPAAPSHDAARYDGAAGCAFGVKAGGCWRRPATLPRVHFDNGRVEIVLPVRRRGWRRGMARLGADRVLTPATFPPH